MCDSDCRGCSEGCGNTVPTITDDQLREAAAAVNGHEVIYLSPEDDRDEYGRVWCEADDFDSSLPGVRYVRADIAAAEADKLRAMVEAADVQLDEVMRERDELRRQLEQAGQRGDAVLVPRDALISLHDAATDMIECRCCGVVSFADDEPHSDGCAVGVIERLLEGGE